MEQDKCQCGKETSIRGILCEVCEKRLITQLNLLFTLEEREYLKEVYYLYGGENIGKI